MLAFPCKKAHEAELVPTVANYVVARLSELEKTSAARALLGFVLYGIRWEFERRSDCFAIMIAPFFKNH
jgi:hypothetical protein